MPLFEEVVTSPDQLVGVKAVWGPVRARFLCFGGRGDRTQSPDFYYSAAKAAAQKAYKRPYLITISGGEHASPECTGRAIEAMRLSSIYGDTKIFTTDANVLERLAQWPIAIAMHDVYHIEGQPLLVEELGFKDRSILGNARDQVVRPEEKVEHLWHSLCGRRLELRDLDPIVGFRDPGRVQRVGSLLPRKVSAEEGMKLQKESLVHERARVFPKLAKEENKFHFGGIYTCEACELSSADPTLFDAHHLVPLALGQRLSVLSDFAVLCPTCHRIAHRKGPKWHEPLSVPDIRKWLEANSNILASRITNYSIKFIRLASLIDVLLEVI